MLEFEHLVQVNDLQNDRLPDITRHQLWEGLVLRARNPDKFNHALECRSEQIDEHEFLRTIDVGTESFRERVKLYPQEEICTHTVGSATPSNAESITRIEEPEAGYLFVRFIYRRDLDIDGDRVDVGEHLKSAYVQVDRDAVALIRLLAESDLFDQPIN